jgi:hypothetical protein
MDSRRKTSAGAAMVEMDSDSDPRHNRKYSCTGIRRIRSSWMGIAIFLRNGKVIRNRRDFYSP